MPSQDAKRASDPEPSGSPRRRLSRRSLLQGAATAGAAGIAATALGAAASPALAATSRPSAPAESHGHGAAQDCVPGGPDLTHRPGTELALHLVAPADQLSAHDADHLANGPAAFADAAAVICST